MFRNSANKVVLVGYLGKDPEIRYTNENVPVGNLRIATTEVYRDKNNDKTEHTEWHRVVVFRKLAEVAENFLRTGKLVYIEGRLRTRPWEDKEGVKRYSTEILADNLVMLGKKDEGATPAGKKQDTPAQASTQNAPPSSGQASQESSAGESTQKDTGDQESPPSTEQEQEPGDDLPF